MCGVAIKQQIVRVQLLFTIASTITTHESDEFLEMSIARRDWRLLKYSSFVDYYGKLSN